MSNLEKRTHDSAGNEYGVIYSDETVGKMKAYQQGRTDTLKAVREAIGEMEYRETLDMSLSSWTPHDHKTFGRNELRSELLQALTKMEKPDDQL